MTQTKEKSSAHHMTANALRALAMDAVQAANSGHPGMPMGMADAATVLWSRFLKFDPQNPNWADRDRFVLSAGHGSMLIYGLLHLSGFDLPLEELRNFRQWGSRTAGHPEYGHTPGVETTTGPLGQGIANAVGFALAERWLAARFNRPEAEVVNHHTFAIAGDGCLMEGISHEACSLAGHLGLGRLILLYDDNEISIDGPTSLSYSDDALARFTAYGWQVVRVDGHDPEAVAEAIEAALADESRPSLIACRTVIGYGSPNRAGTSKAHGAPLGDDEIKLTREALGWEYAPFVVPEGSRVLLQNAGIRGAQQHTNWNDLITTYQERYPALAEEFRRAMSGELPPNWDSNLPDFTDTAPMATRAASGQVLGGLIGSNPDLLGGSADLTGSNKTKTSGMGGMNAGNYGERYIYYGVREHGMGGIMNGLARHGGVIPYGGTFLVFSDYMRGSIRLAALMKQRVIYVFTHDSIGLGEDGPTHQPIEHLASLRAMPDLAVIRPADAWETAEAWRVALQRADAPTALVLTRQKLPLLDKEKAKGVAHGAYILLDVDSPQVVLIGTGSEVEIALAAQRLLAAQNIQARVVSMPSFELFDAMPDVHKEEVLPVEMPAVAVEAGATFGWERYLGCRGRVIGIDRFGASAPFQTIYQKLGITAQAVAEAATSLIS